MLNEPSFPSIADAVELGLVDRVYLAPMYKKLHEAIRKVDDKHIIFFEPCSFDILQTGLTEGPGGADYNSRQVFSYHIYCLDVNKQGDPKSDLFCELDDTLLMNLRVEEARKKKFGGMMLTEFGGLSNSTEGIRELIRITGLADDYFQSEFNKYEDNFLLPLNFLPLSSGWIYWQFKKYADLTTSVSPATTESFYTEDGELEMNKVRALSRAYAQAVAGNQYIFSLVRNAIRNGSFF